MPRKSLGLAPGKGCGAAHPDVSVQDVQIYNEFERKVTEFERRLRGLISAQRNLDSLQKQGADLGTCVTKLFLIFHFLSWDWRPAVREMRDISSKAAMQMEFACQLYRRTSTDQNADPYRWARIVSPEICGEDENLAPPPEKRQEQEQNALLLAMESTVSKLRNRSLFLASLLRSGYAKYKNQRLLDLLHYVKRSTGSGNYELLALLLQDAARVAKDCFELPKHQSWAADTVTAMGLKKLHERHRILTTRDLLSNKPSRSPRN